MADRIPEPSRNDTCDERLEPRCYISRRHRPAGAAARNPISQGTFTEIECTSADFAISPPTCPISTGQFSFAFSQTGSPSSADWPYSQYGDVTVDFARLSSLGFISGYVSVVAFDDAAGTNPRWILLNLPVVTADVLPDVSSMFDLGPAQASASAVGPRLGVAARTPAQRFIQQAKAIWSLRTLPLVPLVNTRPQMLPFPVVQKNYA